MRPMAVLMPFLLIGTALGGERRFERTFDVTPGGTLVVVTETGSVSVTGTDARQVTILAVMRGRPSSVEDFELTARQSEKGVEVRGERPGRSFWPWDDLEIDLTIRVPRAYNVKLETAGGSITLASLQGKADGRTSGGSIVVRDVEGPVTMETSGGDVRAEGIAGDMRLETSGGMITVRQCRGVLDANTSGGDIEISGVEGSVSAETSGGDIDIRIAPQTAATIDASTSGGDITIRAAR